MHVELLETIARVYCDESAVGKEAPSIEGYGYVGLDDARLRCLLRRGLLRESASCGEPPSLTTTPKGRDALYVGNIEPSESYLSSEECADCGQERWSCQLVPDTDIYLCVDCGEGEGTSPFPEFVQWVAGEPRVT